MPTDRSPNRRSSEVGDKDRDRNREHRFQEAKGASDVLNSKTNGLGERAKDSDTTAVPRSRSYVQHDDRRTAARDGRYSGRRSTSERGWWKDSADIERRPHRTAPSDRKERDEKTRAQGGDKHAWKHDKFMEAEGDVRPPTKKRRPFREEKLPIESENVKDSVAEPSVGTNPASSTFDTARREEKARDRRPLERNQYDRPYERDLSFSSRSRGDNTGFPFQAQGRSNGVGNDGKYKGKEIFRARQGYRSNGTRVEKWKHDLFDESNGSTSPKKEEDPVAKVEALLAL